MRTEERTMNIFQRKNPKILGPFKEKNLLQPLEKF